MNLAGKMKTEKEKIRKLIRKIQRDIKLVIHNHLFEKIDWDSSRIGKIFPEQIDNLKEEITKILNEAIEDEN